MHNRLPRKKNLKWTVKRAVHALSTLQGEIKYLSEFGAGNGWGSNKTELIASETWAIIIPTRSFGLLRLFTLSTPTSPVHEISIFGRFEGTDEQRKAAAALFGSNPYSGKWNFHYPWTSKKDFREVVRDFHDSIRRALIQ